MGKSLVERYEQILAQDPTSSVFVELAKALLEKGDAERAIAICQSGLDHHPGSVTARVLWGKALIQLGRPAEAMEQFDRAVGIDKENPHAYNLISEVLLQKGLYRSALPILRKASALQPNDARVRGWLEQTQRALSGGPAPSIADFTLSAPAEPAPEPPVPSPAPDEPAPSPAGPGLPPTDPQAPLATPPFGIPALVVSPEVRAAAPVLRPVGAGGPPVLAPAGEPPVLAPSGAGESPVLSPADLGAEPEAAPPPSGGGLLGDLGLPDDAPPEAPAPPVVRAPPPRRAAPKKGLLEDIPEFAEPAAPAEPAAKGVLTTQATQSLADAYERELREKLAETQAVASRSFFARNLVSIAVGVVVVAALGAALAGFLSTRSKYRGEGLAGAIARAKKALAQDTAASYRDAKEALDQAIEMDDGSSEAWALTGYTHALLFAEHGRTSEDRTRAEEALGHAGVEQLRPGLVLAARYHLSDGARRDELRRQVLASAENESELKELAGRLLLQKGDAKGAVERFKAALSLFPGNVRALVALGDYYREAGDHAAALSFYETASQLSPAHPAMLAGTAESQLAQEVDTAQTLKQLRALPGGDALSPELAGRLELARGRLLAVNGEQAEAVKTLSNGLRSYKAMAFEFQLALGEAYRAGGNMDSAQAALEAALKLRPRSEEAREKLARVLIDRDREREVLARFPSDDDARKVSLVRGIALSKAADWKRARVELSRTELNGKYPSEAVVFLTLADAAEGDPEKAQEVLEKALATTKRNKREVRVALGKVYLQRGLLDRAKAQFESALEDREDYEGGCQLGQLLLSLGEPAAAIPPLKTSVSRNGSHGEARHALSRAYLAQGNYAEAQKQAQDWILDNPTSAAAQKDFAFSQLLMGRLKDAQGAIDRAVKMQPDDPEAHRIRAQVLFARGVAKDAFAALQRSNKLDPKSPETFCEIGRAFLRQGVAENAEAAFSAARREDPKSACGAVGVLQAQLPSGGRAAAKELAQLASSAPNALDRAQANAVQAQVLLALGPSALKDARKAADDAVALAPGSGYAAYALGLVALRQKNPDEALAALERSTTLDGGYPEFRLAYADALEQQGQTEKAIGAYEAFLRAGGPREQAERVRKLVPQLKKKLQAAR